MKLVTAIIAVCLLLIPSVVFSQDERAANKKNKRNEDTRPLFQGAEDVSFVRWVDDKLVLPSSDQPGASDMTVVGFIVSENGEVAGITYIENPIPALSEQIKTILTASSPEWTPGYIKRKPRETQYFLFVTPSTAEIKLMSEADGNYVAPTFEGKGIVEFRKWIAENISYPELEYRQTETSGRESRVVIKFTVDRDGTPVFDKVVSSAGMIYTEEVLKGLAKAPKWTPGTIDGIAIPTSMELTITFAVGGAYGPSQIVR